MTTRRGRKFIPRAQALDGVVAQTGTTAGHCFPIARSRPDTASAARDIQLEVALYIESIAAELRLMARSAKLEALAYFLEMARIEASTQIETRIPPAAPHNHNQRD